MFSCFKQKWILRTYYLLAVEALTYPLIFVLYSTAFWLLDSLRMPSFIGGVALNFTTNAICFLISYGFLKSMDEEDYNYYVVENERTFSYAIWDNQSNRTITSKELSVGQEKAQIPIVVYGQQKKRGAQANSAQKGNFTSQIGSLLNRNHLTMEQTLQRKRRNSSKKESFQIKSFRSNHFASIKDY